MDPHHCFDPVPFLGPWFPSSSAEGRFPPTWAPTSTSGALAGQHDVVSNRACTAVHTETRALAFFSDGSTSPKQHNLCVLEQMFEECLGFVFTKTVVILHTSRINLQEHCNFLSRHYQGLCRGTKPREATVD